MRVISLFDGCSCGRLALDRLGITPTSYEASEIDPYAISVSKSNWPDIMHVGDVLNYRPSGGCDLLMAGSPCQGFSLVGKQLNFNDPRSKLFFEFLRIRDSVSPRHWLLENVRMSRKSEDIISEFLGTEPVRINSSVVSAQSRPRLYWTNLPTPVIADRKVRARDILEDKNWIPTTLRKGDPRQIIPVGDKFGCVTASYCKGPNGDGRPSKATILGDYNKSDYQSLSPIECERLQTMPDNYTLGVSKTQRLKMIGNAWTVEIIKEILQPLTQ